MREKTIQKKHSGNFIGLSFNLLADTKVCIYRVTLHATRQRTTRGTTRDLYTEQFPELIPGWKISDFCIARVGRPH